MIVLMQSRDKFDWSWFTQNFYGIDYTQILLLGLGMVGTMFIFASFAANIAGASLKRNEVHNRPDVDFVVSTTTIGFLGFLVLFPLLLFPFSNLVAIILIIIEIVTVAAFVYSVSKTSEAVHEAEGEGHDKME